MQSKSSRRVSQSPTPSPRSATGIRGLDALLQGGIPRGRTTIVVGGPGAGKTILAMQYLVHGADRLREPGLLVSFEESAEAMQVNFASLNLPFARLLGRSVHVIDGRMPVDTVEAGSFDLSGLIAVIAAQTKRFGLRRLVLDGVDALFAYSLNATNNRREVQRLLTWLAGSGLTAIITVKASEGQVVPPNLEFLEYASDGVLFLDYRLNDQVLLRKLRVVKLRGCGYMGGEHGFIISERGIDLAYADRPKSNAPLSQRRLSTGVAALDEMLAGGYREGTITLISGLPGTAKTTLAGAFLAAGCARKEGALLIGLDETPAQIMLDLNSVGINLKRYERAGLLHTAAFDAGQASIDEQFVQIERLLDRYRPSLLALDPISAYGHTPNGSRRIDEMSARLTALFKSRGVTAVFTAVADSRVGELESTSVHVSTVADTWIHVSYAIQRGERNRTLTIIKARGTAHSNQVRELVLSTEGPSLRKVYFVQGVMLLGTARLEREQEDLADRSARGAGMEHAIRALDARGFALTAQNDETQRELADLEKQKVQIITDAARAEKTYAADRSALLQNMQTNPVGVALRVRRAKTKRA